MDSQIDVQMNSWMNGQMIGEKDKWTVTWMDRKTDKCMDGQFIRGTI